MYVGHLVVETDFWRTGKPDGPQRSTAAIEARYKLLRSGLALTNENIILSNAFTIEQMDVTETINGMSCTNFGQEWLLTEKDQVRFFSGPIDRNCCNTYANIFRLFRSPKRSPGSVLKMMSL